MGRNDLFGPIQLTNLLFQSVEASSKFIHFSLTRNAKILKEVVSVAFQIPAGIWNATETTSFKILAFRVKEKWMNFEDASTDWNNRFVN